MPSAVRTTIAPAGCPGSRAAAPDATTTPGTDRTAPGAGPLPASMRTYKWCRRCEGGSAGTPALADVDAPRVGVPPRGGGKGSNVAATTLPCPTAAGPGAPAAAGVAGTVAGAAGARAELAGRPAAGPMGRLAPAPAGRPAGRRAKAASGLPSTDNMAICIAAPAVRT